MCLIGQQLAEDVHSSLNGAFSKFSHTVPCIEALNSKKSMTLTIYRCVATVVVCWVSAIITLCTVGPAGYNIRQQVQRSVSADKNGKPRHQWWNICWERTFVHLIKSPFEWSPCLLSSCMKTVLQNKWWHCVDDHFAQCSFLGPSSTALTKISIATEVCSLLPSVKWFFTTLIINCERKPCVCTLCSITVTGGGVITVAPTAAAHFLYYRSWKFRSTV